MSKRRVFLCTPDMTRSLSATMGMQYCDKDIGFVVARDGDDEEICGGCIFNRFTNSSIAIHIIGFADGWMIRDFMHVIMSYPFEQLHVDRLFTFINSRNARSLSIARRVGFEVEATIRKVYPDGDQIVLVMERPASLKWIRAK